MAIDGKILEALGEKRSRIVRAAHIIKQGPFSARDLEGVGLSRGVAFDIIKRAREAGAHQVENGVYTFHRQEKKVGTPHASRTGVTSRLLTKRVEVVSCFRDVSVRLGLTLEVEHKGTNWAPLRDRELEHHRVDAAAERFLRDTYWAGKGYPFPQFIKHLSEFLDKGEANRATSATRDRQEEDRTIASWRLGYINTNGASSWTPEIEAKYRAYYRTQQKRKEAIDG
jgi:hypothetical protein